MDSQHLSLFFFFKFPLFIESNIHFRVNWKDPLCYPSKMQNSQPGVIWELQAMGIPLKCILWLSSSNRYVIISRELYKGVTRLWTLTITQIQSMSFWYASPWTILNYLLKSGSLKRRMKRNFLQYYFSVNIS